MHTLLKAAVRINSILGLWSMAGRARESAWTVWSAAFFVPKHIKLYQRVPMTKVCKDKYAPLVPGAIHLLLQKFPRKIQKLKIKCLALIGKVTHQVTCVVFGSMSGVRG